MVWPEGNSFKNTDSVRVVEKALKKKKAGRCRQRFEVDQMFIEDVDERNWM